MSVRSWLYAIARAIGDLNAVLRGRVPRRLGRRLVGRELGKLMRWLFG